MLPSLCGRSEMKLYVQSKNRHHERGFAQRMLESLDNPIWFALTTEHQFLARSHGLARRYPPDVSPLAALLHPTKDDFADLQRLLSPRHHLHPLTASSPH